MRRYELMLLLSPDLEDDKLQAAVEKVTRAIVNAGGSLSKVSPWGKRRLAYDIQRHRDASYFLIHFDVEPSAVREIERGMLISEEILRHLVTVLEDRGPAEELAPAAAARGEIDGDDDGSSRDDVPAQSPEARVAQSDDGAAPEPAAPAPDPVTSEPVEDEATEAEPTPDEPAAAEPAADAEPVEAPEAEAVAATSEERSGEA